MPLSILQLLKKRQITFDKKGILFFITGICPFVKIFSSWKP